MLNVFNELVGISVKESPNTCADLYYMESVQVEDGLKLSPSTKRVHLEPKQFDSVDEARKTITGEFIDKLRSLAYLNKLPIFDINKKDCDITTFERKLHTKIDALSNYIATEGRIGVAQFVLINPNTKKYILTLETTVIDPTKEVIFEIVNEKLISGFTFIVDSRVKEDEVFVYRANEINYPGMVLIWTPAENDNEATYSIVEIGFFPQKQCSVINIIE